MQFFTWAFIYNSRNLEFITFCLNKFRNAIFLSTSWYSSSNNSCFPLCCGLQMTYNPPKFLRIQCILAKLSLQRESNSFGRRYKRIYYFLFNLHQVLHVLWIMCYIFNVIKILQKVKSLNALKWAISKYFGPHLNEEFYRSSSTRWYHLPCDFFVFIFLKKNGPNRVRRENKGANQKHHSS